MSATVKVVERRARAGERVYLPAVVKGLGVTMRHFFANLFGGTGWGEVVTIRYPEERAPYPARFRGLHRLMLRDDGSLRCVACMLCPTVCPAHCITVEARDLGDGPHGPDGPAPTEKQAARFEIDELRCIVCGLCVEACPADAIRMDTGLHTPPSLKRAPAVWDARALARLGAGSTAKQGGTPRAT